MGRSERRTVDIFPAARQAMGRGNRDDAGRLEHGTVEIRSLERQAMGRGNRDDAGRLGHGTVEIRSLERQAMGAATAMMRAVRARNSEYSSLGTVKQWGAEPR